MSPTCTIATNTVRSASRRRVLCAALSLLGFGPHAVRAQQQRIPIADMHSHYGMVSRQLVDSGLGEDMRKAHVALVAWKLIADKRWIRRTNSGNVEQASDPAEGELAKFFHTYLDRMNAYVAEQQLKLVLTPADVDVCIAGERGIVLASEGADFLEGRIENLDSAYRKGLRHLQFVHYIRTPVGDFQTTAPVHNGLSAMGKQLIEVCNAKGVLVDLAHSTGPAVDQAVEISKAPLIWSHGWVDADGGNWRDPHGFLQRRLSLAHAKKIAKGGGVVGLWGLGLTRRGFGWSVGPRDTRAYAEELKKLMEKIGPEHVAIGSDIEGVGSNWVVNDYSHVRSVIDHLHEMKMQTSDIERVAYGNYARVLKAALKA